MLKKLTAGAATGFLLLGAAGVAMAQEEPTFPDLVVFSIQTTENIQVDVAVDDPCADAISALREARLRSDQTSVIQETFLVSVFTKPGQGRGAATLVCAPAGTEPPEGPPPTEEPPAEEPPA